MRRGEYWWLGVFLLQKLPQFKILEILNYESTNINILLGSKNKKNLRGSTEATIHSLVIILTGALNALVSVIP